jgi:hypothetical protein
MCIYTVTFTCNHTLEIITSYHLLIIPQNASHKHAIYTVSHRVSAPNYIKIGAVVLISINYINNFHSELFQTGYNVCSMRGAFQWNAPCIWRDFRSALPFQTCLTQTKPVLPLPNEHSSQIKNQGRWQYCHTKHKKFPYWPTRDVSLLSRHGSMS